MAIIYTYPIVTPQLQDLVVITDASDRNFTKQASIQDIIDLFYLDCSKCDYCTTSIGKITSPFGDSVTAIACDTIINFTSSDASVVITGNNLTSTIDFKTVGGGGGGCPPTYIVKPILCDGAEECVVSTELSEWVWTCDETLGAFAPGYINDFILNGTLVPHPVPGGSECWYIELATLGAGATTCIECCPGGTPTYSYEKCDDAGVYVTVDVDPGLVIGKVYSYCCEYGTEFQYPVCWEYKGEIGQPVGGTFDPCVGTFSTFENCDCCTYQCHYTYDVCPGAPPGFPAKLTFNIGMDPATVCECNSVQSDIVVDNGFDTWCYSSPAAACIVPDEGFTIVATPDAPCNDSKHCPSPETDLRWMKCGDDPATDWKYEDELDPIPAPFNTPGNHYIGQFSIPGICVNKNCCIIVEETISLGLVVAWSTFIAETSCDTAYNDTWEDCPCCENYDVVEYTACDEGCGPPTPIYINICEMGNHFGELWKPDGSSGRPTFVRIAGCCYQLTDEVPCVNETLISVHSFTYDDVEYGSPAWEDCTCEEIVNFQYRECGEITWIDTDTDLDIYHNGNVWGDSALGTCYEINSGGPGGPPIDPLVLFPDEYSEVEGMTACDCCEQDLREYVICDAGTNCDPAASFQIYIDVSSIVGWDPITYATIIAQDGATIQCCYNYVAVAECQPDTGTFISLVTGCEDESCDLSLNLIELTNCADPGVIETVDPSDLTPDPSALTDVDVINATAGTLAGIAPCWRITQLNAPGPVTQVGNTDWNGPIAPGSSLSECQCCEQDLRQYNICEGAAGVTCDPLAVPILLIDVALVIGWDPITYATVVGEETGTGIQCCYTLDEVIPECEAPDGTIISDVAGGCEDIACTL